MPRCHHRGSVRDEDGVPDWATGCLRETVELRRRSKCDAAGHAVPIFAWGSASIRKKESFMAEHRRSPAPTGRRQPDTPQPGGPADVAAGMAGDHWRMVRDYGLQARAGGSGPARDSEPDAPRGE